MNISPKAVTEAIAPVFLSHHSSMPWLVDSTVLLCRTGSHAYGTNTPSSDEDYKGIAIPPVEYWHGFSKRFEQAECSKPDAVVYDIRKFFKLAADCNPSIIELLFCNPEHFLIKDCTGDSILQARDLFLSRKAKHTFSGYAHSQLQRLTTKWLTSRGNQGRVQEEFNGKHAMHCVRLLRMGCEILREGKVNVDRKAYGDADELLDIRFGRGKWGGLPAERLELLRQWVMPKLEELDSLEEKSPLPWGPDMDRLDRLCQGSVAWKLFGPR